MQSTAFGEAPCGAATSPWLVPGAAAQTAPIEVRRADPLDPKAQVPASVYRSACKDYRPNAQADVGSWTDANAAVHQAGGWRAYAEEAQLLGDAAAQQPAAPTASAPGKPAAKSSGHAHH